MAREKILLVGPTGCGKTKAMFDIAKRVLDAGKGVWYMSFDDGYSRHLGKLKKSVTDEQFQRFHVYDCPDWITTRDSYKDIKGNWGKGDWLMMDRVDLAWEDIQAYLGASKEEYKEDELDEVYLRRRIENIKDAKAGDISAAKALTMPNSERDFNNNDWAYLKDALKSVVFDCCRGVDARMKGISVVASEFASYGITRWGGSKEQVAQQKDSRRLYGLGMTIAGEKNVPGYFETTVAFEKDEQGYLISSDKDRERKGFYKQVVDEEVGFWDTYQTLVEEEIEV